LYETIGLSSYSIFSLSDKRGQRGRYCFCVVVFDG